jgi:hypothetical protein
MRIEIRCERTQLGTAYYRLLNVAFKLSYVGARQSIRWDEICSSLATYDRLWFERPFSFQTPFVS